MTFWTEPSRPSDRLRELIGSSRCFRRDFKRALGRLREIAEGGEPVERVGVAGGDRLPAASGSPRRFAYASGRHAPPRRHAT